MRLSFTVPGIAAPQGSKKHVVVYGRILECASCVETTIR